MENYIEVNGQKLEVIFTFNYKDNEYMVYMNELDEISASRCLYNNGKLELQAIIDDKEWQEVEKIIEEKLS